MSKKPTTQKPPKPKTKPSSAIEPIDMIISGNAPAVPSKKIPQKVKTKTVTQMKTLGGGGHLPSIPSPEDLKKIGKKIPGMDRWIYGSQFMACTELLETELNDLLDNGLLIAIMPNGAKYNRHFDHCSIKDLRFPLLQVFELEDQGKLYLGDSFVNEREAYRRYKSGESLGGGEKKILLSLSPNKTEVNYVQTSCIKKQFERSLKNFGRISPQLLLPT